MEVQSGRLESLVQEIGEALLVTTETVEKLSSNVDGLAKQVQQQGLQIFALSDALQTMVENQDATLVQLKQVTDALQRLVTAIEDTDDDDV